MENLKLHEVPQLTIQYYEMPVTNGVNLQNAMMFKHR